MKKLVILAVCVALASFKQTERDARTKYFPKTEQIPGSIPPKEDVWVFMLAGQSNMAGRGLVEPQDTVPSERILTINRNGAIIVAKEPLHFYEPSAAGLDCGLSFGKELLKQIPDSISLLIIPAAVGGSSISQWLADVTFRGVPLFTNFREKVEIGKKHGTIKAVLWHQGENDANEEDIPLYRDRLSRLIKKFRDAAGNKGLPVIIGELGSFSESHDDWDKINYQIRLYASTDSLTSTVKTNDLKDKGDKVHFNSEGQRVLGQSYAEEYIRKYR